MLPKELSDSLPEAYELPYWFRRLTAAMLMPAMRLTGWRFSKRHRHEDTLVYRLVSTVDANIWAGM